jgi:hypothetical protein
MATEVTLANAMLGLGVGETATNSPWGLPSHSTPSASSPTETPRAIGIDMYLFRNSLLQSFSPFNVRTTTLFYCRILGLATEYNTSVKKFTATYVNPIARMHPCTR